MHVAINHLTRMRAGYICAAGVDLETFRHVRPVLEEGALPFDLLARYGGPLEMAGIVELGRPRPAPEPPHVEDHVIVPARARSRGNVPAADFWALLCRLSKTRLREIFGGQLRRVGRSSCGADLGRGEASLGCFRPSGRPRLFFVTGGSSGRPRIRMRIDDGQLDVLVGVTDIRLYGDDHVTPDRAMVEQTSARLEGSGEVILGVGLTRGYASSAESEPVHWVQVNNIHLEADPTWPLG